MPFIEAESAAAAMKKRRRTMATMTLVSLRGKRPNCQIAIGVDLGSTLEWKADAACALLVGKGEDAGRLRLVQREGGAYRIRRLRHAGAFLVALGHIPGLGTRARAKTNCVARRIDALTIEIEAPEWDENAADVALDRVDEAVEKVRRAVPRPRPAAPPPPSPPPVPQQILVKPARSPARFVRKSRDGRVGISASPLSVWALPHAAIEVSEDEAEFIGCLIPAIDGIIVTEQICAATNFRADELAWMHKRLEPRLKSIGLHFGHVCGMGYIINNRNSDDDSQD